MSSKRTIAIIAGGDSSEIVISLKTAEVVFSHLDKTLYDCYMLKVIGKEWTAEIEGKTYRVDKNDFSILTPDVRIQFDCACIAIHGTPGEDGKLQGYFDLLKIPYTTPSLLNSAVTFSKWYCTTLLKQLGIRCANSVLLRQGMNYDESAIGKKLGFPCFVKPNNAGSSFGISKVKEQAALAPAIQKAFGEDHEVLIESAMVGREVTCGVLNYKGKVIALPITEIVSQNEFFDFEAKYKGASQEITPAQIDAAIAAEVQQTVIEIYHQFNMTDIIRVDFILEEAGPSVIEINTVPGLTEGSLIPQQAIAAGISLTELFGNSIEQAILNASNN